MVHEYLGPIEPSGPKDDKKSPHRGDPHLRGMSSISQLRVYKTNMYGEVNKNRGQSLFTNKVMEALNMNPGPHSQMLQQLCQHFMTRVGVQQDDEAQLFAAARIARACVDSAEIYYDKGIDVCIEEAVRRYAAAATTSTPPLQPGSVLEQPTDKDAVRRFGRAGGNITTSGKSAHDLEIEKHFERQMMEAAPDIEGDMFIISHDGTRKHIKADTIDLIKYADVEDLSAEGKVKLGMLPADFDPENDDENDLIGGSLSHVQRLPEAIIQIDADGYPFIACPECGESDIYQVTSAEYKCFSCDKDCEACFTSKLTLDDTMGTGE